MKDWLTEPDPKPSLAMQVLQAICKTLLAIVRVAAFLWSGR